MDIIEQKLQDIVNSSTVADHMVFFIDNNKKNKLIEYRYLLIKNPFENVKTTESYLKIKQQYSFLFNRLLNVYLSSGVSNHNTELLEKDFAFFIRATNIDADGTVIRPTLYRLIKTGFMRNTIRFEKVSDNDNCSVSYENVIKQFSESKINKTNDKTIFDDNLLSNIYNEVRKRIIETSNIFHKVGGMFSLHEHMDNDYFGIAHHHYKLFDALEIDFPIFAIDNGKVKRKCHSSSMSTTAELDEIFRKGIGNYLNDVSMNLPFTEMITTMTYLLLAVRQLDMRINDLSVRHYYNDKESDNVNFNYYSFKGNNYLLSGINVKAIEDIAHLFKMVYLEGTPERLTIIPTYSFPVNDTSNTILYLFYLYQQEEVTQLKDIHNACRTIIDYLIIKYDLDGEGIPTTNHQLFIIKGNATRFIMSLQIIMKTITYLLKN